MWTLASPRESLCAGIALCPGVSALVPRPLVIVSPTAGGEPVLPDAVGQVRRAELLVALALRSVAGRAYGREGLLAASGARGVVLRTRKREHVVRRVERA